MNGFLRRGRILAAQQGNTVLEQCHQLLLRDHGDAAVAGFTVVGEFASGGREGGCLRCQAGGKRQKHRSGGQQGGRPRAAARGAQEKSGRQQGQVGGDDRLSGSHPENDEEGKQGAAADVADVVPDVNQGSGIVRAQGPQHKKTQWKQKPDEQGIGCCDRGDVNECLINAHGGAAGENEVAQQAGAEQGENRKKHQRE